MTDITELKIDFDKAKRDEQRAHGEMTRYETQTNNQQAHLNTVLTHRDECVTGLRTAKESGINIVQIREYQLLLKHLDSVVKEQTEKVDISQVDYEKSRDAWTVKNDRLAKLREMMAVAEEEMRALREQEINRKPEQDKMSQSEDGLTGRRLKTS